MNTTRFPDDAKPIGRFVVVGRVGETDISDDVSVVEEDPPVRRTMKRVHNRVSSHGGWRKALANAVPFLAQPPRGVARLLEIGIDAEDRLCLVFESQRLLPRWLSLPRSAPEAARLAVEATTVASSASAAGGARALDAWDVDVNADREVTVRNAGVPPLPVELRGEQRWAQPAREPGDAARVLLDAWGFPLPERNLPSRAAYDAIVRIAAPDLPWRTRPPGIAEGRRCLDALTDFDIDEVERVKAALVLSRAKGLEEEVVRLLVRTLNEPLGWLPKVALELLTEWPEPFGLRVDDNGLLRRCPHAWAGTEIVSELGGTGVERHCADCDARVVLPQSVAALAHRCEAARALTDVDERDGIDVVEAHRRYPLRRGELLSLDGALDLVNVGGGRLCLRHRTMPGDVEVQPFKPGARIRVGYNSYAHTGDAIVVEYNPP